MTIDVEMLKKATEQAMEEDDNLRTMRPRIGVMIRAGSRQHFDDFFKVVGPYIEPLLRGREQIHLGRGYRRDYHYFFVVFDHIQLARRLENCIDHVMDIGNRMLVREPFEKDWYERSLTRENAGGIEARLAPELTDISEAEAVADEHEQRCQRRAQVKSLIEKRQKAAFEMTMQDLISQLAEYLSEAWVGLEDKGEAYNWVRDLVDRLFSIVPASTCFLDLSRQSGLLDRMVAKSKAMAPEREPHFKSVRRDVEFALDARNVPEIRTLLKGVARDETVNWHLFNNISPKNGSGVEQGSSLVAILMNQHASADRVAEGENNGLKPFETLAMAIVEALITISEYKHEYGYEKALIERSWMLDKKPMGSDMVSLVQKTRPAW